MPDRKFALTPLRFLNRTSTSRFTIALSVPALALAAVLAGGGSSAGALAQPTAKSASSISGATPARLLSASTTTAKTARRQVDRRDHDGDVDGRRDRLSRNREIAWQMMPMFGWKSRDQFRYLNRLWDRESSWNVYAMNPYSGAYGIPQAVPGGKMATAGSHWRTSAKVQIRWGLRYIKSVYGSPRGAWAHETAYGWY